MPNMSLKKNPMPHQEADVRNKNFEEVALGYTPEQAMDEAERCLNCKHKPCVGGCPVNVHIPEFIAKVREGDFEGAYQIISQSSSLPAVCGRVCPQESQCEKYCAVSRANPLLSVDQKDLLPTITTLTAKINPLNPKATVLKLPLQVQVLLGLLARATLLKRVMK